MYVCNDVTVSYGADFRPVSRTLGLFLGKTVLGQRLNDSFSLMNARIGGACESDLHSLNLFNRQTVARPVVNPGGRRTFVPGDLLGYLDSPT